MAMPGLVSSFSIAANIKDDRRIVDFFESRRIGGVVDERTVTPSSGSPGKFFTRQLSGLSGGQGLRGDRLESRWLPVPSATREIRLLDPRNAQPTFGPSSAPGRGSGKAQATREVRWQAGDTTVAQTLRLRRGL